MFGLGLPELIVIFVIALLVFGPKKLPELGKSLGRAIAEFKKASQEFQDSMHEEMKQVENATELEKIRQSGQISLEGGDIKTAQDTITAPTAEKEKSEHDKRSA